MASRTPGVDLKTLAGSSDLGGHQPTHDGELGLGGALTNECPAGRASILYSSSHLLATSQRRCGLMEESKRQL